MRVKRIVCMVLMALMLLGGALAESFTVTCTGCTVEGLTQVSFEDRSVFMAVADDFDDVVGWKINGVPVQSESPYYIRFAADADIRIEALYTAETPKDDAANQGQENKEEKGGEQPKENGNTRPEKNDTQPEVTPTPTPVKNKKPVVVRAVGAKLQYLGKDGKGAGDKYEEIDFTNDYLNPVADRNCEGGIAQFKVVANFPHGSGIDYWVINGARYYFYGEKMPTAITVGNLRESMTIEVVYKIDGKRSASQTALTKEELKASKTGETKIVRVANGNLALVEKTFSRVGKAVKELDFTDDYTEPQTRKKFDGGYCNINIRAGVDKQMLQEVRYWKFDDVSMVFDKHQDTFSVFGLTHSITYTAVIKQEWPIIIYYSDLPAEGE